MISQFFIERPIFANVIALVTVIIGLIFLNRLPVAQYPQIVPPTIQVTARYPGASAEVVAATIGVPIEQAVNGVEGSIYMSSTSGSDGSYNLTITFDVGTDLNTSLALVQNLVNTSLAQLPGGAQQQGVTVKKVSPNILLVASLYADDERFEEIFLSNYAVINLQNPLARLPGVGQVRVFGAGPYSMRVWLDAKRLQSFDLTTSDILTAIQRQNVQVVAGQLGAPPVPASQSFQFTVTTLGRLSDVGQFEDIVVKTATGPAPQVVRLRDVARVDLSQQNFSNYARFTGHKSAQIVVFALPDANAIDVADSVYKALDGMSKKFPDGMKYAIRYDTTKFVREAISSVYDTLFIAAFLVLFVILLFLQNIRAMLVPATTVPVTIIGAFIAMAGLGFTINLMTLFALVLVIGIVVDDAIVIVESSSYYIEKGLAPKEATIKAMRELTGPVMGITLALVAVFLPAAFFPGITGQIFRQFALVIASTAVISAINALTLKPVQCALWLRPRGEKRPNWFYRGFNRAFQSFTNVYIGIVARMVKRPVLFVVIFAIIVTTSFLVFINRPLGFLPTEDQGYGVLVSRIPEGASQPRSEKVAVQINEILKKTSGVDFWVHIGGLSILDGANVSNMSTTFVVYKDWSERGSALNQDRIIASINRQLAEIQEAQAFVVIPPPIRGLGQTGGFQMMVEDRGSVGLERLKDAADELMRSGNSQPNLKGLASTFSLSSPQLYLDIDRTKAEALLVPLSNVFETLQAYLGSSFVNLFNKYNQVFQVYIQADSPYRIRPEDIGKLYVRNQRGEMVPLGALINVRQTQGPELITRYNLYPAAAIFGSAAPGFSSGQALTLMERMAAEKLPEGIDFDWTSTSFQEKKVGKQAYFIYALSVILVYMVLAALYESWTSPAAIILVVPIALVGVLLALIIRGYDNNLYTQVGLVLMIALASKNAILIVEFARDLHHGGMSIAEAAIEATRRRFRPIVMTSFAFILGVVPLVVAFGAGSAGQRAIGSVVFGGMISSTLLAIPFVPVFYVVLERMSEWVGNWRSKRTLRR
ncbi:transporter, hydrophobe/amphiphile efflux-1 (HAE1) family [Geobacter metallireducens RCH3]|uniref:Efflux pump, RND family, inner membrane protein n=1 Tax=Geobacter metallireducens (strain ATCC 53774 / DSM 7210 / GS-15) TaxID=269799 RepID=Q39V29_GEOMG|nr:multidrug efflux RND transporter permease subunit [Geobacter metallireducens]ABB31895.1 efflux pump, RND family, inner membrane protein [Geobacter metallireducens GS-15]EHP89220.1 transporter, hydrophobe/amphiphile efflux-1 (HAE1) family [Geobacter metallireducens RCH3]